MRLPHATRSAVEPERFPGRGPHLVGELRRLEERRLRSQAERVEFDYDATAPISKQVESVLDAVAKGLVAPDVAKSIVETIGTLSQIRATEDLEARIAALEERQ